MLAIKFKPLSNNLKKYIALLKHKDKRTEANLFIAEGVRLCSELLSTNYSTEFVVVSSNADESTLSLARKFYKKGIDVYIARRQQFVQLCDTQNPQDILAVVRAKQNDFILSFPLVVLDGVSDPGNFGTIIRTSDWFGVKTIVTSKDSVDKFNPKVIRGSMGSFFRVNVIQVDDLRDFLLDLKKRSKIFAASLKAKTTLEKIKFFGECVFLFGNEAVGISPEILNLADNEFLIKGSGAAESLNLAVSVGIVLYSYFVQVQK